MSLKKQDLEIFDPHNPEHRRAYFILKFHGRQHPTLRFKLLPGYANIPAMMNDRLRYTCFDQQEIDDVLALTFQKPETSL